MRVRSKQDSLAGGNCFLPLHFAEKLCVVNPFGSIGVITLWSGVDYVMGRMREFGIDLRPEASPIAVVGTLYGNGLRELLRNLLYNPQIDTLILLGRNRSGSADELAAFFAEGLEPIGSENAAYEELPDQEEAPATMRIKGTSRIVDSLVTPAAFQRPPRILNIGSAQDAASLEAFGAFLESYAPVPGPCPERRKAALPEAVFSCFPGNPRGHAIVAFDALSAWKELIFRLHRFGVPVELSKGKRRELQNIKVVVEEPGPIDPEKLAPFGFSKDHLERYQHDILSGVLNADEAYSYGNRLRSYFGLDSLDVIVERLLRDPADRQSYAVLWDPRRDLLASEGHPCLVTLFFRLFQNRLTLTATFRTHNALDAWVVNFYGLMAILDHVARQCGMRPGAITVFSQSITIDARQMDRAAIVAGEAVFRYNEDPNGYFRITLDGEAIVVEQQKGDLTLKRYRHPKASYIQHEICKDCAVSDIGHAIYLGRQLARAENALREGKEYIQE